MALPKCSCILLMALLSLSICSAIQTSASPKSPEPKNSELNPDTSDAVTDPYDGDLNGGDGASSTEGGIGAGDSKWSRGSGYPGDGGYGRGDGGWGPGDGGYPGAGGYGGGGGGRGGWGRGGPTIPRMPSPVGEPVYCRPINCDSPYSCRGFTLYLNINEIASYRSQDARLGRHQYDGDDDVTTRLN